MIPMTTRPCGQLGPPRQPALSRRQFAAAGLSLVGAGLCRAESPARAAKPPANSCTFGFGTYGMGSLTTEQAVRAIAEIGFDSVMLDCAAGLDADPARMSADRRGRIRRLLADTPLRLPAVIDELHPDSDDRKNAVHQDHLKAVAQLCHDLTPDQPVIVETILGGAAPWAQAKALFLRRLAVWTKIAEASEATLAIKPHSGMSLSRPEQAVELFRELDSPPRLKLCYDYSHFVLTDLTLAETIRTSLPWTVSVVIKDAVLEGGKRVFKLPGETGLIDYPAMLRQFFAGGYRGDFNCEISSQIWRKPGYDPIATAKKCYANISPAFAAASVPRPARK